MNEPDRVFQERFIEARKAKQPEAEILKYFKTTIQFYLQSLELSPPNAVDDLEVTHNQLGQIFSMVEDIERALPYYCEAVHYHEAAGNL